MTNETQRGGPAHSQAPDAPARRRLIGGLLAAPLAAVVPRMAYADVFPSQPLRLIVPFPAGGSSDILSRTAAVALSAELGRPIIVENRGGAGGNIAADYVAHSAADGYTLLLAGPAVMAINPALYAHVSYDAAAFEYVGMLGDNANVLVSNTSVLPARNLAELVAAAKAQPGKITFGSNGIGSLSHLSAELFSSAAGVRFLHVPYRGAAPLSTDLLGGRIDFCVTGSTLAAQLVKQGPLRALAVTTPQRIAQLPDVPTFVEAGYPSLNIPSWWTLVTTPGTPAPVLARLRQACAAATATPAYQTALARQATLPLQLKPEAAPAFFASERAKWAAAVKSSGATAS